ncbi:YcaQ family DNA glycosylase [Candidatus Roizmanbacteria bacterium]|nr:YcaQ family DNA glycosylase [Candidatus Roizmanbacteria bacterium]
MKYTRETLKLHVLSPSLFTPTSLENALEKLAFVQADPIRSPARAQDLILRHRVKDYYTGDLEKHYPSLPLEEDYLYAHGFMVRDIWRLLHPRNNVKLTKFDREVLAAAQELGEILPKSLDNRFKPKRVSNWWGGHSQATKMALERLHYYGFLRIARRQKGLRIYQTFTPLVSSLSPEKRLEKLIMAIVRILAPVTDTTLTSSLHRLRNHFGPPRPAIETLLKTGELEKQTVDGINYLTPAGDRTTIGMQSFVKFLAPFDPLVWDRRRFEHLWRWPYRFEAYTPKEKRVRGYYAMPLLWNTEIIGWANVNVVNNKLTVDLGFVKNRPKSKRFENELSQEISNMKSFLKLNS